MKPTTAQWREIYLCVALTSMATLLLELSLTRIFSVVFYYHFAFLAISIALFGLGLGGVFSYVIAGWKGSLFAKLGRLSALNSLLIVDAVTSLGGHPVGVDRNGIDICYSGTQKCIGAPPGLAPITFNERALDRVRSRRSKVQSWYLDITMVERYWGDDRTYHHTAPISMNYAMREALRLIHEEGLENRWRRHERNHRALVAGIEAMGLQMAVGPANRLWSLNAVSVPEGIDDSRVRARLLDEDIEIGGGLGPLKGKIWRIGLMGSGSTGENVYLVLDSLHRALNAEGFNCRSGIEAAQAI